MFIDSHCHLQLIDYEQLKLTEAEVVNNATKNGVAHMLCVATCLEQFAILNKIASTYKNVSISIGSHPNEDVTAFSYDKLLAMAQNSNVVAIGETGLDYYRTTDLPSMKLQQDKFRIHIQAALKVNKALIIHTRTAKADTLKILAEEQAAKVGGVIHCFTEDLDMALKCIDLGFHISFSGIISFKNATSLQQTVQAIPLNRILIETDSPYLAPVPMRGKINQPAYVKYVAASIAKFKNLSIEEVGYITTQNYYKLFGSDLNVPH